MERNWDLSERTDGRLYTKNDMVKAGCNDCKGCSACCHGMGESIVLDPYDIYRMVSGLHVTMEELMAQSVELHVVDGVILPNLKMQGTEEACGYLDTQGRCTIHAFRPGICRLFPLGRLYEEDGFRYFLQVHECKAQQKTKVKIKQWLDTPDLSRYEAFILEWHDFLKEYQTQIKKVCCRERSSGSRTFGFLLYSISHHISRIRISTGSLRHERHCFRRGERLI